MEINIENSLEHMKFLVRRLYKSDEYCVINAILSDLGFPAKMKGNRYIITAILHYPEQICGKLQVDMYELISQTYGGYLTKPSIDKAMHDAIATAWANRKGKCWEYYFPGLPMNRKKPPTNHEFIAEMARIMVLWKGLCQTHEYELRERRAGYGRKAEYIPTEADRAASHPGIR